MKINIKQNGKAWDANFKQVIETGKKISLIKEKKQHATDEVDTDKNDERSSPESDASKQ